MRLFIALPLPDEVETLLGKLIADFRQKSGNVKWVPPENVHLTLKFLGDTDEQLVSKISREIDEVARQHGVIETVVDQVGGFPNLRRPRVIWVGISQNIEAASRIARQVDLAMRKLRFEKEKRPFKAHLTLGRVRQGRPVDELAEYIEKYTFEPVPLYLDRLTLFKSTLTPKGAIYERLHEAMLGREQSDV